MRNHVDSELVAIYYAGNLAAADVVKARLEEAGIAAFVSPSRLPASDGAENEVSSVRVLVAAQQAGAAQDLLRYEQANAGLPKARGDDLQE